jgi:dimeric dUTPase (all-alpha-NTP-PPase superfamily)
MINMNDIEREEWIKMLRRKFTRDNFEELLECFINVNDGLRKADEEIKQWRKDYIESQKVIERLKSFK